MRSDRVLVYPKHQFIGDAVMATPLLDALSRSFERPSLQVGPAVQALLADRADRLSFVAGGSLRRLRDFIRCARQTRKANYDAAIILNRSFRSALLVRLAGIPVRIGHAGEGRSALLTRIVPYDEQRLEAECFLDLGRAIGVDSDCVRPRLSVTATERESAPIAKSEQWLGVQPGARSLARKIPVRTLIEAVDGLRRHCPHVVLLGGPEEREEAAEFSALLGGDVLDLVGQCELRQTMGVLTHLNVLIGGDTGLMHVAAAVGCPTVTVFGVIPARKWGHHYDPHAVIQAPENDVTRVRAEVVRDAAAAILRAPRIATARVG